VTSLAPLLVAAVVSASGLQDLDACPVATAGSSAGTVESVREVPVLRDLHAFDEHKVHPETAEELVVRLDVGPLVVFTQSEPHRLHAGERVRVTLNGSIARVERAPGQCLV
jgi:hypothetical protein